MRPSNPQTITDRCLRQPRLARGRVVAKSRRVDMRPLWMLLGLSVAAVALGLSSTARADIAKQRCYTLMGKPAHLKTGYLPPMQPQAIGASPVYVAAPHPAAGGTMQMIDRLPAGQAPNQAYYVSPTGQPVLPPPSGTSGLGVVINGQWYPEPNVAGYFYYVEVQGDASVYCEPGVPVVYQQPNDANSQAAGGVMVPQAPEGGAPIAPASVPIGYAGAPCTVFQPVIAN